jgi:hypothetical protein
VPGGRLGEPVAAPSPPGPLAGNWDRDAGSSFCFVAIVGNDYLIRNPR